MRKQTPHRRFPHARFRSFLAAATAFWLTGMPLLCASPAPAEQVDRKTVRVGVYQNYPMVFTDKDGAAKGFYVDLLLMAAKEKEWSVEFIACSWAECLVKLERGDLDIMTAIAYSAERTRRFDFTSVTVFSNWGQLYLSPGSGIRSIQDLPGRRVAHLPGDIYLQGFQELIDSFRLSCTLVQAESYGDVLRMVESGDADAGIVNRLFGQLHEQDYDVVKSSILFTPVELRFALPKGKNRDLLQSLDQVLGPMVQDRGSAYYRALNRWVVGALPLHLPDWVKWAAAGSAGVLVFGLAVNVLLRAQVRSRTAELAEGNRRLLLEIEERSRAEEAARHRLEFEEVIAGLAARFVTAEGTDAAIDAALVDMGVFCRADRAYLFQARPDGRTFYNSHEWCAAGVQPEIGNLQMMPQEAFPWLRSRLKRGETVSIPDTAQLPPEAGAERAEFQREGIRSLLLFPVLLQGEFGGFIGFDSVRETGPWDDDDAALLQTAAGIIGAALARRHDHAQLLESRSDFQRLSLEFNALLDVIPDNLTLQAPDLSIVWANRAAADRFGQQAGEITGTCYSLWHGRDRPCDVCPVLESFQTGKTASSELTTQDGRKWELRSIPVKDANGRTQSVVEVGRDITEHRQLEERVLHAHRLEGIGQLAGGIAHDFNNILNVVVGFGGLLQMGMDDGDPLKPYTNDILEAGQRGAALTRQILAFSRKQVLTMKPVDLNEIVRSLGKMLHRLVREDIEIVMKLSAGPLTVLADASHIDQVLINLATNARDAMPRGGRITIDARSIAVDRQTAEQYGLERTGDYALLTVADTGVGMEREIQAKMFDPFFTTKEQGKGTGLGLSVVHGIIRQHKGYIDCASQPGRGAAFRIFLPLTRDEAEPRSASQATRLRGRGELVLVAEDDPGIGKLARHVLEDAGYRVIQAANGREAVCAFLQRPDEVALVLTDMIMPVMNGWDAYEEMRRANPSIKALFISGYSAEIAGEHGSAGGGWACLRKPFLPGELLHAVRETLEGPGPCRCAPERGRV